MYIKINTWTISKQFTRTLEGTKAGCTEEEVGTWDTKDVRRETFYCVPFFISSSPPFAYVNYSK